jgi:hypothetical protein
MGFALPLQHADALVRPVAQRRAFRRPISLSHTG